MPMTVEISFGKVVQALAVAGVTAIIVYLWTIDSRVTVLEKQQNVVERVERLEEAMLPVLATWKAEELLEQEMEEIMGEGSPFPVPVYPDLAAPERPKPRSKAEVIQEKADNWAREQLQQQPMRGN